VGIALLLSNKQAVVFVDATLRCHLFSPHATQKFYLAKGILYLLLHRRISGARSNK
jgi:hypothetical protein